MRKSFYLIAGLSVLLASLTYQILIYQSWVPSLIWSADTLYLNVTANRSAWMACKKFRWCDEGHAVPNWRIVWRGEARFEI